MALRFPKSESSIQIRQAVNSVIDWANSDKPQEIQEGSEQIWTSTDIENVHERDLQWKARHHKNASPPRVADFLGLQIEESKQREQPRVVVIPADFSPPVSFALVPRGLEPEDASASQNRLRAVLDELVKSDEASPKLLAQLESLTKEIELRGSAANPKFRIATLDQWWGAPLATLSKQLIGRVHHCKFRRCSNYFVAWPGWRGGQPRLYCSKRHERAENAQVLRDKKKKAVEKGRTRKAAKNKAARNKRKHQRANESLGN